MITNNLVDLTGHVFNIMCNEEGSHTRISFTISVGERYRKNGEYQTVYDSIFCTLFGYKDETGNHRKSFDYFNQNVTEGQLIRIQGRMTNWLEGLINGELVPLTAENKDQSKRTISRNSIRVTDYSFLETKENALKRIKEKYNQGKPNEERVEPERENQESIQKQPEQSPEPVQEQLYDPYRPTLDFPSYQPYQFKPYPYGSNERNMNSEV